MVVRRPYVFIYRDERDPCERGLVNLAQAKTEYSLEQQNLVRNAFRWDKNWDSFGELYRKFKTKNLTSIKNWLVFEQALI